MREINLLPPVRRRALRHESLAVSFTSMLHSVNAGLMILTGTAAVMIVSFMIFSLTAARTTQEQLTEVVEEYQGFRDVVATQNAVLQQISSLGRDRIVWSETLQKLFEVVPPGVTISQMSGTLTFAEGTLSSATLTLDGQALTRSTLIVYEERLRAQEAIAQVQSPTSNLLERDNPRYQFNVVLRTP